MEYLENLIEEFRSIIVVFKAKVFPKILKNWEIDSEKWQKQLRIYGLDERLNYHFTDARSDSLCISCGTVDLNRRFFEIKRIQYGPVSTEQSKHAYNWNLWRITTITVCSVLTL